MCNLKSKKKIHFKKLRENNILILEKLEMHCATKQGKSENEKMKQKMNKERKFKRIQNRINVYNRINQKTVY